MSADLVRSVRWCPPAFVVVYRLGCQLGCQLGRSCWTVTWKIRRLRDHRWFVRRCLWMSAGLGRGVVWFWGGPRASVGLAAAVTASCGALRGMPVMVRYIWVGGFVSDLGVGWWS